MRARLLAAVTGGLLTWAAFDPIHLPPLVFLGLALLGYAMRGARIAASFLVGFLWGLSFFLPLVSWTMTAVGQWLPWIALCLVQALVIAGGSGLTGVLHRERMNPVLWAGSAATLFTAAELVRTTWPWGGFPWGKIAYAQVGTPLVRTAPYLGAIGVTFLAVFLSFLLAEAIALTLEADLVTAGAITLGVGTVIGSCLVIGLPSGGHSDIRVGWVQGGPAPEDGQGSRALEVTKNHRDETLALMNSSTFDVLVWPESSSDRDARTDEEAAEIVTGVSTSLDVPLLMGTQEFVEGGRYNDYLAWSDGEVVDRYSKSAPVPFGEYIPYRDFFRKFSDAVDLVGTDMLAGEGPATLTVDIRDEPVTLAVPICFEVAIDSVVRDAINAGGEAFIVPVNTASFGHSAESMQQLRQTTFRAIEYGRVAIQVSTVGVSGVVYPNGAVTYISESWQADSGVARIPLRTELTPAAKFGDIYNVLLATAAIASVLYGVVTRQRKNV